MVVIRPAFEPNRRMKYVLYAVHDNRRVRHLGEFYDAFDA